MAKTVNKTTVAKAVTKLAGDYTGADITELPFPLCVQQRPQMYIGPNDAAGFLTSIREIVNNSVDEWLAGFATTIVVTRHDDYSFSVYDNGRGVPFDKQEDGSNTLSKIFGKLHAGRNFEKKTVYSTGLNGVGASCVNALSGIFYVEAQRGTDKGEITFENGYQKSVKVTKNVALPSDKRFKKSSTRVNFQFNPEFFEADTMANEEDVVKFLRETAQLNSGLTVEYHSCHQEKVIINKFEEGVKDFLVETVGDKGIIKPIYFPPEVINDTRIEIAIVYNDSFKADSITSFTNTIKTTEGGTHVTGFKRSLSQKMTAFIREKALTKEKIDNDDVFIGLEAVVSVFVFNPKYSSQTKQKLTNTEVMGHAVQYANAKLDEWLNNNPKDVKVLAAKFALSAKSRLAQKRALDNVKKEAGSFVTSLSDISKFVDCQEKDGVRTELYLVEGDSAGGTVKDARDKRFQAVYKLKGKPKNVFGLDVHKARDNEEVDDIVTILKCGAGAQMDIEKLKFNKIIILADADSDGKHIEMLSTTMFGVLTEQLIREGRLYIAVSPLYRVVKDGHKLSYLRNETQLNAYLVNEIESSFNFVGQDDKVITAKKLKENIIGKIRTYLKTLGDTAKKYNINPRIFESVFIQNFDEDEGIINMGDRIEISEVSDENVNIIGFHKGDIQEDFVCIVNVNGGEFMQDVSDLYQSLSAIASYSFTTANKAERKIEGDSYFEVFNALLDYVKKSVVVTRFKGWGEASAEDIWNSTLDPERRQLIRINAGDDMMEVLKKFMGKDPEFRKEFLTKIFNETDTAEMLE